MFAAKTDIPCVFTDTCIPYILFDRGGGGGARRIFFQASTHTRVVVGCVMRLDSSHIKNHIQNREGERERASRTHAYARDEGLTDSAREFFHENVRSV